MAQALMYLTSYQQGFQLVVPRSETTHGEMIYLLPTAGASDTWRSD